MDRIQAAAFNQADFMQAVAGENRALWRDHVGVFSLNKPMSTDAGVDIMAGDIDKARKLLTEAGYTFGDDGIAVSPSGSRLTLRLGRRDPNPRRQRASPAAAR